MNSFKDISTERCILRKMKKEDGVRLYEYRSLPEVSKYQGWSPASIKEAEEFISKYDKFVQGSWLQLAIIKKEDNKLIGDCGIHFVGKNFSEIEIGFSLDPKFQGKGFASESITGLLDYIFKNLKTHRVFGSCDPANGASIKLMERIGMRKEAHFIKSIWFKGGWADDVIYAVLEEEWHNKQHKKTRGNL